MKQAYDYIIIGSGSAGAVIATRLSERDDVSVLLIEAGGSDSHYKFKWPAGFARMTRGAASWGWSTVPQKHMNDRVLWYTQGKVRGGGSSINAMVYTRGNAKDYDAWRDEAGCPGWGYADVLPYFCRAEDNERFVDVYHGNDGPLGVSMPRATLPVCDAFIRAGQEYGLPYNHDFNGVSQEGIGFYQVSVRNGKRSSVAICYLDQVKHRSNLDIVIDCEVSKILVEKEKATGVSIIHQGYAKKVAANEEVILAAGAIGSPRLLQLSGIGPADHLKQVGIDVVCDSPNVGSNLQDHIDVCVLSECTGNHSYDSIVRPDRMLMAGIQYLLFGTGPVTSTLFETGGFWYTDKSLRSPDIQFHFGQGSGIETGIVKLDNPGVTLNSALMRPRSRGTVRLASSDLRAEPLIDPNFWADPKDKEDSLQGLQMARDIMNQPELKPFIKHEILPGPDVGTDKQKLFEYGCKLGKTDHHPVGTCKMGTDKDCVVDNKLRFNGIENLRVCDSSVIPLIISSNTHAVSIMIGEKASDLIANKQLLPPAKLPSDHPCATKTDEPKSADTKKSETETNKETSEEHKQDSNQDNNQGTK